MGRRVKRLLPSSTCIQPLPPEEESPPEEVNLPARSVKSIVAARFGSLEEDGGWADVTRLVGPSTAHTALL